MISDVVVHTETSGYSGFCGILRKFQAEVTREAFPCGSDPPLRLTTDECNRSFAHRPSFRDAVSREARIPCFLLKRNDRLRLRNGHVLESARRPFPSWKHCEKSRTIQTITPPFKYGVERMKMPRKDIVAERLSGSGSIGIATGDDDRNLALDKLSRTRVVDEPAAGSSGRPIKQDRPKSRFLRLHQALLSAHGSPAGWRFEWRVDSQPDWPIVIWTCCSGKIQFNIWRACRTWQRSSLDPPIRCDRASFNVDCGLRNTILTLHRQDISLISRPILARSTSQVSL